MFTEDEKELIINALCLYLSTQAPTDEEIWMVLKIVDKLR